MVEVLLGPLVGEAPTGWECLQQWGEGWAFRQINGGLRVIVDNELKDDGRRWIHVSVSRKAWTPTHEDMALVKSAFIGDGRYAYSAWVPSALHVNIHPHCLHLWSLAEDGEGRVLPEFSAIVDGVGRSV